jgi:maleate cis-trans isomerase
VTSHGIVTATEVGTLGRREAIALVHATDHSGADAVLLPDTALHTIASLAALEDAAGKPVLTANQVSAWEAMRLARAAAPARRHLGHLFSAVPTEA